MTNREYWLKLFNNNDVALLCAISLVTKIDLTRKLSADELEFIRERIRWLNSEFISDQEDKDEH